VFGGRLVSVDQNHKKMRHRIAASSVMIANSRLVFSHYKAIMMKRAIHAKHGTFYCIKQ